MKRIVPYRRSDRSFFKRTADKIKKINIDPVAFRGGIRL